MCNTATYLHLTHQMTAKKTGKTNKQFWQLGFMLCLYTFFPFLFLLISMKTVVTSTGMSQGPWLWNRFSSLLAATPEMGKEDLRPRKSRESPMKIPWVWRCSEILETFGCPISGFPLLGQYEILTMGGNGGHFTQRCPRPLVNTTTTCSSCFHPSLGEIYFQMRPSWEVVPLVRKSPSWAISFDYLVDRFPAVSLWAITQVE